MLGLGLSLSLNSSVTGFIRNDAQIVYDNYYARVTADGGTVEGEYCFETKIFLLGVRG